jgi:hypothetical protein
MKSLTISVNDVIDVAKSEPGLAPHALRYLETLRAAWFTREIKGSIEFTKLLRSVISPDTVDRILQELVPPSYYKQLQARAADEKLVANTLLAMSSSP